MIHGAETKTEEHSKRIAREFEIASHRIDQRFIEVMQTKNSGAWGIIDSSLP
jgi:hypothetical protein